MTGDAMDDLEQQLARDLRGIRRGRAPILLAIGANILLSALLLGVPYLRGHEQAIATRAAFVDFSACLFDADEASRPGLSLPAGERMRFAMHVLSEEPGWQERCDTALQALAPPEAIFLWPSVKTAGGDVREAVKRMRHELHELQEQPLDTLEAVPERPLLVFGRLRAALALFAKAAHADEDLDRDAITFPATRPTEPARLPVLAAQWAPTEIWSQDGYVEASAADARGISWLRLEDGGIKRRRPRRTSLIRGTMRTPAGLQVVWATPEKRCEALDDHCAHHATGVAPYDTDSDQLPRPRWLSGHPLGRLDQSLQLGPQSATLLARMADDRKVALRTFRLDALPEGDRPLPADTELAFELKTPIIGGVLMPTDAPFRAWLWTEQDDALHGYAAGGEMATPTLVTSVPGERPFAKACVSKNAVYVLVGSDRALRLLRLPAMAEDIVMAATHESPTTDATPAAAGASSAGGDHGAETTDEQTAGSGFGIAHAAEVSLGVPLLGEHVAQDAAQLLCDGQQIAVVYRDAQQGLWSLRCSAEHGCSAPVRRAERVATYAANLDNDVLWTAYSRTTNGQIRLRKNDEPAITPAPCFDPRAGLCGQPTLLNLSRNLILAARDGADLLAVMSTDQGQTFGPLPGLQQTVLPSDNSAMQQHRIRKGEAIP